MTFDALLTAYGLSAEDLARKAGVTALQVAGLARPGSKVSADVFSKVHRVLHDFCGVTASELEQALAESKRPTAQVAVAVSINPEPETRNPELAVRPFAEGAA